MNLMLNAQNAALELYDLLLQDASIFGRLIYIAGLWNPETKRYERGLPERFRHAGLDQAISRWHHAFFMEWLALSLAQQQNDVAVYWTSKGRTRDQIREIRQLGEAAIPPLVEWAERRSFLQNLTFIQTVLSHEAHAGGNAA